MAVKIDWQPPAVQEERKQVKWERIIRHELGDIDGFEVSLQFEADSLRWRIETRAPAAMPAQLVAGSKDRVVGALRAAGKPVL
jgi:hypothetical protein